MGKFVLNLNTNGSLQILTRTLEKVAMRSHAVLLRIRTWEYRQLPTIHRASRPSRPDKARRLGIRPKKASLFIGVPLEEGLERPTHRKVSSTESQRTRVSTK